MSQISVSLLELCEEGNLTPLREWASSAEVDQLAEDGTGALHLAAGRGFTRCVRVLVAAGASLDIRDSSGRAPLHCAIAGGHANTAILLLHSGANPDAQDSAGDGPIHVAARKGLTSVCRTLCSIGCRLDVPNKAGLYPIHLAARHGHIDFIRCLCLAGCNVEQRNRDGIKAEITAFKYGHLSTGELLNKLRIKTNYDSFVKQLNPTDRPLTKLNVKIMGAPGSGKTTLVRSLRAGYFIGLFSRTKSLPTYTNKTAPGDLTQIEMDLSPQQSLTQIPPYSKHQPRYHYTRGIEIHQACFSSGDVTLWDFSGLETYYSIYDMFLNDPDSLFIITFNLKDNVDLQFYKCLYWLNFLTTRLHLQQHHAPVVTLVGTHADTARLPRDANGSFSSPLAQQLIGRLEAHHFPVSIHPTVILVDGHLANSQGIRDLRQTISNQRAKLLEVLLNRTGLLDASIEWLTTLRRELQGFPVLPLDQFLDRIHRQINPLVGEDDLNQLLAQLKLMGEAMVFKWQSYELVVFDLPWLCGPHVLGGLLSLESIGRARLTGCYTEDDFQGGFPCAPADRLLPLLSALNLCTECENDGETEYEFPCLNMVETLDGLWAAADERYSPPNSCYAGVLFKAPYKLLQDAFPRLQVELRRTVIMCDDPDGDLYQWFRGSKMCTGDIEGLLTLEDDGHALEVKVRGTNALRAACFYFMEEILTVIQQVLTSIAPGALWERHVMSCEELRLHSESPHIWPPQQVFAKILEAKGLQAKLPNPCLEQEESVLDLVAFGVESVLEGLILGGDLNINQLPVACQQTLAALLDPPDPLGRDWCLLAVNLGLGHRIAQIDSEQNFSKTTSLLDIWAKNKESTISNLINKLIELGREDASQVVLQSAPLYRLRTDSTCSPFTPPTTS